MIDTKVKFDMLNPPSAAPGRPAQSCRPWGGKVRGAFADDSRTCSCRRRCAGSRAVRWAALAVLCSTSVLAEPAFLFESNVLAMYVPSPGMGTGAAVADFDADGDPDIFVPTGGGEPNLLFRNRGDGTFDEVAADFGLDDTRQARVALWVDYDGDGDLDLFVGRDCHITDFDGISAEVAAAAGSCSVPVLSLYAQTADGFVDVSESAGLFTSVGAVANAFHAGGLSAADVSGDGLPDIYFARWQAKPELYISDTLFFGGGEAPGYSLGSGLTAIAQSQAGHWQGLMHDFDYDDRLDLFVNVDFAANQFWLNGVDLNLVDAAADAGVASSWNEMGLAAGDYDNDGDIDLFITNIFDWNGQDSHNLLYRNDSVEGAAGFTERAIAAGVDDAGWGWGASWLDADNDGDLDLAVTNGYCEIPIPDEDRYCEAVHERDRSRFFENRGEGNGFVEVGEQVGFDDTLIGAGLIAADFDGDGRLDLLQTAIDPDSVPWEHSSQTPRTARLTIYRNRETAGDGGNRHAWVRPVLAESGSPALGAVVRVYMDNGEILSRLAAAGESWMSQAPATLHFGLGATAEVERVEIDWPQDSADSVFDSLPINDGAVLQGPETLFGSGFE